MQKLLSPKQASEFLGISRQWLARLANRGDIECVSTMLGNLYKIADLRTWRLIRVSPGRPPKN